MEKPKWYDYQKYLESRAWMEITGAVKHRDGHKCIICGSTEKLQVHHKTYKHIYDEWDHLDDLVTLCSECHKDFHEYERKITEKRDAVLRLEWQIKQNARNSFIQDFIRAYKHLDYAFGGSENLCKYETIEKYWHEFYGYDHDDIAYKEAIQRIFRDFKIEAIQRMKAEGKSKSEIVASGIPYKWVSKYWNGNCRKQ